MATNNGHVTPAWARTCKRHTNITWRGHSVPYN